VSWSVFELASWCCGEIVGDGAVRIAGISTDTRTLEAGQLYVAIRGENFDGHDFVPEAIRRGAAAVLVSEPGLDAPEVPVIRASDTIAALAALAARHRRRFDCPVIGVTGSNGKTTTKEICAGILTEAGRRVHKTPGNFNNHIGLPLSILALDEEVDVMVLELGMNHPGEIDALARIAAPTVGAITQVAEAHLGLLGSLEAIGRAKGELLDHLPADGMAALNADDPHVMAQRERCVGGLVTFGFGKGAEFRASELELLAEGSRFVLETPLGSAEVEIGVPGRHIVEDALCAAAAAHASGLIRAEPLASIRGGFRRFGAVKGRTAIVEAKRGFRIIDDTYNANPASVEAALRVLERLSGDGRRAAVLGDMLELGPDAPSLHASVGRAVAAAGVEVLLGIGALSANTVEAARESGVEIAEHAADTGVAVARLDELIRAGDTVLVKGSRGMKLETIAAALLELD
jgi:UDP-N-acetylmuramoyl-tripeptide--D-alanyl-D-alanine ligase